MSIHTVHHELCFRDMANQQVFRKAHRLLWLICTAYNQGHQMATNSSNLDLCQCTQQPQVNAFISRFRLCWLGHLLWCEPPTLHWSVTTLNWGTQGRRDSGVSPTLIGHHWGRCTKDGQRHCSPGWGNVQPQALAIDHLSSQLNTSRRLMMMRPWGYYELSLTTGWH